MLMSKLIGSKRVKASNHEAKKLRRDGKIPAVLYGMNLQNTLLAIGALELNKQISVNGEHGELIINVDGVDRKTLIKEIQREPVDHNIIHIDLEEVNADKIIVTEVPLHFVGEDIVRSNGGILQKEKDSIKVQCAEGIIPKYISIDFSNLHIGDSMKVGNVEVSEGITILDDEKSVIASIGGDNTDKVEAEAEVETEAETAEV